MSLSITKRTYSLHVAFIYKVILWGKHFHFHPQRSHETKYPLNMLCIEL